LAALASRVYVGRETYRYDSFEQQFFSGPMYRVNICFQESILQNFFSLFFFFGIKLGHFTINKFFLYVPKMQAYQRETEKFFDSKEKKVW